MTQKDPKGKTAGVKGKKTKPKRTYISLDEARERARIISNVNYTVALVIPRGKMYFGTVAIEFDLAADAVSKGFFLDFEGRAIKNLTVNGKTTKVNFRGYRLWLKKNLKAGTNKLTMVIFNKYGKEGFGLHSSIDSSDHEQYLYTKFEPDYGRMLFPQLD